MNKKTLVTLLCIALGMFVLAFSSVYLYRIFCEATGYGGTTRKGEILENQAIHEETMVLRLDANISKKLPWQFFPEKKILKVAIGHQPQKLFYVALNTTNRKTYGQATYNVTPHQAAPYFYKIDCFCFTQQHLGPHEKKMMPVIFYIDPAIKENSNTSSIDHITLSYTFFPLDDPNSTDQQH